MMQDYIQKVEEEFDEYWGSTAPDDSRYFNLKTLLTSSLQTYNEKVIEIIKKWKNEGDNPTETDLVLENILKELK